MAFCSNCGTEIGEQATCPSCGASNQAAAGSPAIPFAPPVAASEYGSSQEAQVRIGIDLEPPEQSRLTILFRLILLIPLFIVEIALSIAGFFAAIGAWFAALITGRVPDGIQAFLTGVNRYILNVSAYQFLVVKTWPGVPFNPAPTDQVTLDIDHVDLNRAAVFFRLILVIPAGIVGGILNYGAGVIVVIMWFWGIVAGREPRALHQGVSLVVRYQARLYAYFYLLTPTQPWGGVLGDEVVDDQAYTAATNPAGTQPVRWVITRSARIAVIVMIVIGAIIGITVNAVNRSSRNTTPSNSAPISSPAPAGITG
jgi:hypothetical protein